MAESALASFRSPDDPETPAVAPKPGRKATKAVWTPLTQDRIGRAGTVMAFDQSLRKTAWVVLRYDQDDDHPTVLDAGMCRTKPSDSLDGWPSTLRDARTQVRQIADAVDGCAALHGVEVVAHEAPPFGSNRIRRPESSILTSLAVWLAAETAGVELHMLNNQSAKHLLTGLRSATKPVVGKAVMNLTWIRGLHLVTNEDLRDAVAVALTYFESKGCTE